MNTADRLATHAFAKLVLDEGYQATRDLYPRGAALDSKAEPSRAYTELEYYLAGCGYSLSHLLSLVTQLEQIAAYVATPRRGRSTPIGVTRVSDLIYHWENYLIRGRGVEDRALQLVSDVLHLGLHSTDVHFGLIRKNAHVASGEIALVLDELHRLVAPLAPERNRVVHERGLLDDELRRLEFWLLIGRILPERRSYAQGRYLSLVRRVVPDRAETIKAFLSDCESILLKLFSVLETRYRAEALRLGSQ